MAPPDQTAAPDAAPTTAREPPPSRADERTEAEPEREPAAARHQRDLSSCASFSSAAASTASSSASTAYLPASSAGPDLASLSSFSSSTSYESFFHIDAADLDAFPADDQLDLDPPRPPHPPHPATRPPAAQTMVAPAPAPCGYDPKRLPSSMFRTRSTNPAEWSVNSNESLFSIQLSHSHSGDLGALYADLYYDAAGFPARLPSSVSEPSGGLCVKHDCARCHGSSKVRKSVRFASTERVVSAGESEHSAAVSTVAVEEAEAPASGTKGPAAGWCELWCCWPTAWWSRCCGCRGCGC